MSRPICILRSGSYYFIDTIHHLTYRNRNASIYDLNSKKHGFRLVVVRRVNE